MTGLGLRPVKLFGADTRLLPLAARLPGAARPADPRPGRRRPGRGGKRPSLHLHLEAGDGASVRGGLAQRRGLPGRRSSAAGAPRSTPAWPSWSMRATRIPTGAPGSGAAPSGCSRPSPWPRSGRDDRYTRPRMDTRTLVRRAASRSWSAYLIGGIPWGVVLARARRWPRPAQLRAAAAPAAPTCSASSAPGLPPSLPVPGPRSRARLRPSCRSCSGRRSSSRRLAVLAAIIGHSRSPYIGFRGGRGVSPAFGVAPRPVAAGRPDHHSRLLRR